MEHSKLVYSIPETMLAANAGRTSVYRAIKQGELVARKRGRRTVILAEDLNRWLAGLVPIRPARPYPGEPNNPPASRSVKADRAAQLDPCEDAS